MPLYSKVSAYGGAPTALMEKKMNEEESRTPGKQNSEEPEPYGWEFHKGPLLIALILTLIFYGFVYFFVKF